MDKNTAKITVLGLFLGIFPVFALAQTAATLSFSVNPQTIEKGSSVVIAWTLSPQNSGYCSASGAWSGQIPSYGTANVYPTKTENYGISCSTPNGIVSDIKTVFVNGTSATTPPSPVLVSTPTYNPPTYYSQPTYYYTPPTPTPLVPVVQPVATNFPFTAACAASPSVAEAGKSVTFAAAQNGGSAPFTYSWSENITGSKEVEYITFATPGVKTAKIFVRDSRNLTAEGTCSATIISQTPPPAPAPAPTPVATTKKPTVVVAQTQAPTCKTVTLCIDTAGNITQQNADNAEKNADGAEIKTAEEKKNGSSFLASLSGAGNGSGGAKTSSSFSNIAIYIIPNLAAAAVIFIGFMAVRFSKKA